MPDTPVTDQELIDVAAKKAALLGLNSFLLWNVTDAVLYVRDNANSPFYVKQNWPGITSIRSREEVQGRQTDWVAALERLMGELNGFFHQGVLSGLTIVESFSNDGLIEAILRHSNCVADAFKMKAQSDHSFDDTITIWWSSVKSEYPSETSPLPTLAKITLVNWINKFVFAHVLKAKFTPASRVDEIAGTTSAGDALSIFQAISNKCDFLNVFSRTLWDDVVPDVAWSALKQLNRFLSAFSFDAAGQDFTQSLLYQTVSLARRKSAGQFATPPPLADLLARLTVLDKSKIFWDPFCGTGTIPRATRDLKVEYGLSQKDATVSVWASDKFSFPLQLTTLALVAPENMGIPVQVFRSDLLDLTSGMKIDLVDPLTGQYLARNLPAVDYIGSNLPFVKQEDIERANPGIKEKINAWIKRHGSELTLDGKSDLLAYFPFWLWGLLSENGRIGIITSNSWLGTKWGARFREILQRFYRIEKVVISGCGRWFQNAEVVTTILLLEKRPLGQGDTDQEKLRFCTTMVSIDDWGGTDIKRKEMACAIAVSQKMDGALTVREYTRSEIRVLEKTGIEWSALFADVGFLHKLSGKLLSAGDFFSIARGERRGWDSLFYPEDGHGIEDVYLRPVLKSSRDISTLIAKPDGSAFCCPPDVGALTRLHHKGALAWIRRFEGQLNDVGTPLPEVLRRAGMHWYQMDDLTIADLICPMNPDKRLFIARMQTRAFVNQRLIRFTTKQSTADVDLLHALLNSALGLFFIEALGFGRGLSVLDINATKLRDQLRILNPVMVSTESRQKILNAFRPLLTRPVLPLPEELDARDRFQFDQEVLAAFDSRALYGGISLAAKTLYNIRKAARPNT